jgi:hypothetical protein
MNYVYAAVGLLLIALSTLSVTQCSALKSNAETISALKSERDQATVNETTLKASAKSWEVTATQCAMDSEVFKQEQAKNTQQNKDALAAAQRKALTLQNGLAAANAKIAAASRAGPCAAILNTPVCAEALQ